MSSRWDNYARITSALTSHHVTGCAKVMRVASESTGTSRRCCRACGSGINQIWSGFRRSGLPAADRKDLVGDRTRLTTQRVGELIAGQRDTRANGRHFCLCIN